MIFLKLYIKYVRGQCVPADQACCFIAVILCARSLEDGVAIYCSTWVFSKRFPKRPCPLRGVYLKQVFYTVVSLRSRKTTPATYILLFVRELTASISYMSAWVSCWTNSRSADVLRLRLCDVTAMVMCTIPTRASRHPLKYNRACQLTDSAGATTVKSLI